MRGMVSAFHQLCLRYSGTLTPTAPIVIRLWETFTFFSRNCCKFYANNVDSDQTPPFAASDLCLHCLHIFACGLVGEGAWWGWGH